MQGNERERILKLVENGTISAEDAIVLLEKLSNDLPKEDAVQPLSGSENSSVHHPEEVEPIVLESKKETNEQENEEKKKTINFEERDYHRWTCDQ